MQFVSLVTGSPHTTAGVTASSYARTIAAAKLVEFKFEFELPPHESQLIPTAPTPSAAAEPPPARTYKRIGKSRQQHSACKGACASRIRSHLPPAHRRRDACPARSRRRRPWSPRAAPASCPASLATAAARSSGRCRGAPLCCREEAMLAAATRAPRPRRGAGRGCSSWRRRRARG